MAEESKIGKGTVSHNILQGQVQGFLASSCWVLLPKAEHPLTAAQAAYNLAHKLDLEVKAWDPRTSSLVRRIEKLNPIWVSKQVQTKPRPQSDTLLNTP